MNKDIYELSYTMKKDLHQKISFAFVLIFSALLITNLILVFVIFPVRQTSVSMQPDIPKESCVMFTPLNRNFKRGSVVLLKKRSAEKTSLFENVSNSVINFCTARQFSPFLSNKYMGNSEQIRRVIGIPGDEIYMRDYVMYIKPKGEKFFLTEFELIEKNYNVEINSAPALWDGSLGASGSFETITLAENEYFVLGDERNSAVDSRLWGVITNKNIKASALFVYLPVNKFKFF
ncbi:MAG: signal peptidase I [Treponema sp.]|nr:signal peptidase I [Treponema sp.]